MVNTISHIPTPQVNKQRALTKTTPCSTLTAVLSALTAARPPLSIENTMFRFLDDGSGSNRKNNVVHNTTDQFRMRRFFNAVRRSLDSGLGRVGGCIRCTRGDSGVPCTSGALWKKVPWRRCGNGCVILLNWDRRLETRRRSRRLGWLI